MRRKLIFNTNQTMDNNTAVKNFNFLNEYDGYYKPFFDDKTQLLSNDERWFPGMRRQTKSRFIILEPIATSMFIVYHNSLVDDKDFDACVHKMNVVFTQSYPNFSEIHVLLEKLSSPYFKRGLPLDFNPIYYINSYKDLIKAWCKFTPEKQKDIACEHYLSNGKNEDRLLTPNDFDPAKYVNTDPDLVKAFESQTEMDIVHWGCEHFIHCGEQYVHPVRD